MERALTVGLGYTSWYGGKQTKAGHWGGGGGLPRHSPNNCLNTRGLMYLDRSFLRFFQSYRV